MLTIDVFLSNLSAINRMMTNEMNDNHNRRSSLTNGHGTLIMIYPRSTESISAAILASLSDFGSESGSPTRSSSLSGMNLGAGVQPEIGFVDVEGQGDKHIPYEIKLATPLLLLSKVRNVLFRSFLLGKDWGLDFHAHPKNL